MRLLTALCLGVLLPGGLAFAQDAPPEPVPFEGGAFTITETPDFDKILAYDGQELARNYVVFFDRTIKVGETNVALFDVGDGGNQCGPATVLAWKKGGAITTQTVGEDCGAPPAAVTANNVYFVPSPIPGDSMPMQVWSPEFGLRTVGIVSFTPEPGTGWNDLDPDRLDNIVDAFHNEAVYRMGLKLLGDRMAEFATGLLTGGGTERTVDGVFYASGCVPHACGSADSFMAVDPARGRVYFAQAGEQPEPTTWPSLKQWPADMQSAMKAALEPPQ